jgi:hypothetical protein
LRLDSKAIAIPIGEIGPHVYLHVIGFRRLEPPLDLDLPKWNLKKGLIVKLIVNLEISSLQFGDHLAMDVEKCQQKRIRWGFI